MKIVVQNVQKRSHLATDLIEEYQPDILLAQELMPRGGREQDELFVTNLFGGWFGTGIYYRGGRDEITNIRRVDSPHAEFGGVVWKKTIVATIEGVDWVSFHGYNGFPWKTLAKLLDHVLAVVKVLHDDRPTVFAGDFNTWTQGHLEAVQQLLADVGFSLVYSWRYPSSSKELILDHVFVRNVEAIHFDTFSNASDHDGCFFKVHDNNFTNRGSESDQQAGQNGQADKIACGSPI